MLTHQSSLFLYSTPWLHVTVSINGRPEREPHFYSALSDIDVFQEIVVQSPADDDDKKLSFHRSCPLSIQEGYAVVSSPPMPSTPQTVVEERYVLRAETVTQDWGRIFCIEESFEITE